MITRATEYACLAMLYLAKRKVGGVHYTADIAREQRIPPSFLAKVINQLSRAGLLIARRGPTGGIELAREPHTVTLRHIVEAMEGEVAVNVCTSTEPYDCFRSGCALKGAFQTAQQAFLASLDSVSLADLVNRERTDADLLGPVSHGAPVAGSC
jgi:Rrf2 family protein